MKNLAINIPNINDATAMYRAVNPLSQLRERCKYLNGLNIANWSEATVRVSDGAFFQRPFTADHLNALIMAKDSGRKVWVDYDDYLLGVPTDNPTHSKYMSQEIQVNVQNILREADIVTVSTEHLKKLYSKFNSNIKVARNGLDMGLRCMKERGKAGKRNKIIAWRGSRTHHRDVFTYARTIMEISRDPMNKDWQWHFIGDNLWFLTDSMPHYQTFVTKPMSPLEYFKHIKILSPSAFMVPLHDGDFNRSKSNIAWLEASYAGAITIAPDWEEWQHPGILKYKTESEFSEALRLVIKEEIDVSASVEKSWEYIMDNFTVEKINDIRLEVLCELFECDKKDLGA